MTKNGILLVNIGTPDAPRTPEVRRYLREFLGDPRVIDIPPLARWLLLNLVILPTRPAKSAEAYRKIWTDDGSPLLVYGEALAKGLEPHFPGDVVRLAMRYGNPSIPDVLAEMEREGCERIVLVPLYPQNADSSTGTSVERVEELLAGRRPLTVVPAFYDAPELIGAFAREGREVLEDLSPDHVLFSFHGLPERHMRKGDPSGSHCLEKADCCATITDVNKDCYRAQCYATARLIASELDLEDGTWSVAFQSRLGRTPWIRPYTDVVLPELAAKGVERVAVFCPAFVADCLETLEEIGMRAFEDFREAGGEDLRLVPSLNAEPDWIDGLAAIVKRAL